MTHEEFWSKVEKSDACWQWTGALDSKGYGHFRRFLGQVSAHRASWVIHFGLVPDGMFVCHHCDNRQCVRPDHLFLGTAKDNALDMTEKGRHARQAARGERSAKAVLTEQLVRQIRAERSAGAKLRVLSQRYGVSIHAIHDVVTRTTWKHVQD